MSNYTETFSGQTTGANSTTFTNRFNTETHISVENPGIGEQDSRVLKFASGATAQQYLQSMDSVDADANRDNCEILVRVRQDADAAHVMKLWARASGSASSENGYCCLLSGAYLYITRVVSGSPTTIGYVNHDNSNLQSVRPVDTWTNYPPNEWLYFRFRVNGTGATVTLQARFWRDGEPEPTNWYIDTTDTNAARITAAGWVGVGQQNNGANLFYDAVAVGTNGDTAVAPVGTANVRATGVVAEAMVTNNATPVRITGVTAEAMYANNATPVRVTGMAVEVMYSESQPQLYEEDFGSQTTDATPSGWTDRWDTDWVNTVRAGSNNFGDKYLEVNPGTTNARRLLTYDSVDGDNLRADCEMLCRVKISGITTSSDLFKVFGRASGAAGNESGYLISLDIAKVSLVKYVNGASTSITYASTPHYTDVSYYWYWLRFRINGTALQVKFWRSRDPEPPEWNIDTTDVAISAAGWCGVGNYINLGSLTANVDYFAVGTGGLSPALPVDASAQINLDQLQVDKLGAAATGQINLDQLQVDVLRVNDYPAGGGGGGYAPIIFINS